MQDFSFNKFKKITAKYAPDDAINIADVMLLTNEKEVSICFQLSY